MSQTSANHSEPANERWYAAGLVLILCLFAWLVSIFYVPAFYGGVDESAYLLTAKQLATRHTPAYPNPDPEVFVSENMIETSPGVFVAKYPVGYPLLCAVAYWVLGTSGPFWVNPIMGALLIAGAYLLVRHCTSPQLGLLAAFVLALHPLIVFYSVGALSHMADAACVAWGFYFALRWNGAAGRGGALTAAGAGLLLGYAVTIRYSEALLILPLGVLVFWRYRTLRHDGHAGIPAFRRDLAAMMLAAGAALLPLFWYQLVSFGSPLATGYGLTHESSSFSLHSLEAHCGYALLSLNRPGFGLALIFPLALAYIIYAAARQRWMSLFLAAWIFPPLLLYMAYYWSTTGDPTLYIRFFLPIFPALLLGALLLIHRLIRGNKYRKWIAIGCLGALTVWGFTGSGAREDAEQALATARSSDGTLTVWGFAGSGSRQDVEQALAAARFSDEAAKLAASVAPAGSTLLCDRWTAYFMVYAGDYTVYYPSYFDESWVRKHLADQAGGDVYQFNPLRARRFAAALGGRTQAQLNALLIAALQRRAAAGQPVFLLTTTDRLPLWEERFQGKLTLTQVAVSPYAQVILAVHPAAETRPSP